MKTKPLDLNRAFLIMRRTATLLALLMVALAFPASAGNPPHSYSIDWYKVAGGGDTSTGGVYAVSGTIGQHDAGIMTGGRYGLAGGYWAILAVAPSAGAPLLGITLTTTNTAMVYWPSPSTGWSLQQNNDLKTVNWVAPAETVNDNGTIRYIIANPPTGNRFYRLKQ